MKVAIIIPYIREHKIEKAKAYARLNSGIAYERFKIYAWRDMDGVGCPKMVKKMVERTKSEYVCFLGDDTLAKNNYLKKALTSMKIFKDGIGLVGFGDGTYRQLPTHWLAHRKLLPMLGGEFFHTGYKHCYCDQELWERCAEKGLAVMNHEALVTHDHPLLSQAAESDEHYQRVYSKEYLDHDKNLYLKRKLHNWFQGERNEPTKKEN